jgi:hypothetical protein
MRGDSLKEPGVCAPFEGAEDPEPRLRGLASEADSRPGIGGIRPRLCRDLAEKLRRVDVAAEDVDTVMDAAAMLSRAGTELERVLRNRDRLMRNRNNKQRAIIGLRAEIQQLRIELRAWETGGPKGSALALTRAGGAS